MNHIFRVKISRPRNHRRASGTAVRIAFIGLAHYFRTTAAVDRSVDASASSQATVRCVYDRINLLGEQAHQAEQKIKDHQDGIINCRGRIAQVQADQARINSTVVEIDELKRTNPYLFAEIQS